MERFSRLAVAVAAGYLLAFSVVAADVVGTSWIVPAVAASATLAAGAGIRAVPSGLRVILGSVATAGFTILGVIGAPIMLGLLVAAALVGGGTMSLFDGRRDRAT
jgi:hypothetical protein